MPSVHYAKRSLSIHYDKRSLSIHYVEQDPVLMRKVSFVITRKRFTYLIMKIYNATAVIHGANIYKKIKNIYELIQLPD